MYCKTCVLCVMFTFVRRDLCETLFFLLNMCSAATLHEGTVHDRLVTKSRYHEGSCSSQAGIFTEHTNAFENTEAFFARSLVKLYSLCSWNSEVSVE